MIRAAIIEDNPERMELHKQALKRRKCIVVGYTTVEAGISGIATSLSTDLIISDLNFDPDDDSNQDGLNIGYYLKRTKYPGLICCMQCKILGK